MAGARPYDYLRLLQDGSREALRPPREGLSIPVARLLSTGLSPNTKRPNFGGTTIDGGVTRKVVPGDVVIIPGNVPHWWSVLDTDIRYLIFRPDPEGLQPVR